MIDGRCYVEHVDAADHFVDGAEAEFRMLLAKLPAMKKKKLMTCSG